MAIGPGGGVGKLFDMVNVVGSLKPCEGIVGRAVGDTAKHGFDPKPQVAGSP